MTLPAGTHLGPYEILAPLGAGGMGEVYRARDTRLGREVAVKVLPEHFAADEEMRARFLREARAVSALSHPRICALFDVGAADGTQYLVMELLEGETLRARLAAGALPPRKAIELGMQIAEGLAAAHDVGILHRDLKPENVFVTPEDAVKLLDFGLARQEAPAGGAGDSQLPTVPRHTEAGTVLGTVGYMAPEQVRAQAVDRRTDVFALGCVLYEMLCGRRAFRGATSADTMSAVLHEDPRPLSDDPRISRALDRIVHRCLEKRPAARFESARDVALALEAVSEGSSVAAGVPLPAPRRRARPFLLGLLAGLAVATTGAFLVRRGAARPPLTAFRMLTFSGHDRTPAGSPDGATIAFVSDRDGRARIWLKRVATGSEAALTSGPDDAPRFSRDGSWVLFTRLAAGTGSLWRASVVGGEERRLVDDASAGDLTPDGASIVFARPLPAEGATAVMLAAADGSGPRELARLKGRLSSYSHPRVSPDGRFAVLNQAIPSGGDSDKLAVVELSTGRVHEIAPPPPWPIGRISSLAWVGPREAVYAQSESVSGDVEGGTARLVKQDLVSGASRALHWLTASSLTVDRLGTGLVLDQRAARENLRDVPLGGGPQRWLTHGASVDREPAISPDGESILFASNRGNLDIWELTVKSGALRRVTDDPAEDWDPAWSADGKHILFSSNRSGVFEIYMAERDGSGARRVSKDGVDAENPSMTPDGRWIFYAGSAGRPLDVWRVRPDGTGAAPLGQGWGSGAPEVSPDGVHVATLTRPSPRVTVIRVARVEDSRVVPFEIRVDVVESTPTILGRLRWIAGGKAIAFIGQDAEGRTGVFAQDFVPGEDTSFTRRRLGGFDEDAPAESFAVSPDGTHLVIAALEQTWSVVSAAGLPGVGAR